LTLSRVKFIRIYLLIVTFHHLFLPNSYQFHIWYHEKIFENIYKIFLLFCVVERTGPRGHLWKAAAWRQLTPADVTASKIFHRFVVARGRPHKKNSKRKQIVNEPSRRRQGSSPHLRNINSIANSPIRQFANSPIVSFSNSNLTVFVGFFFYSNDVRILKPLWYIAIESAF